MSLPLLISRSCRMRRCLSVSGDGDGDSDGVGVDGVGVTGDVAGVVVEVIVVDGGGVEVMVASNVFR